MPSDVAGIVLAILSNSNLRMFVVYSVSVLIAIGVALFAKCRSHQKLKLIHLTEITLATIDFVGDLLFIVEVFEKRKITLAISRAPTFPFRKETFRRSQTWSARRRPPRPRAGLAWSAAAWR